MTGPVLYGVAVAVAFFENGRLLLGTDVRGGLSRPSAGELIIDGADFALHHLAGWRDPSDHAGAALGSLRPAGETAVEEIRSPEVLLARGVRRLTKLVLFPVRFLFTAATGLVGTNDAAGARYLADGIGPSATLVAAAFAWRTVPPKDYEAAAQLLRQGMVPLYLHYIDDHITRLYSLGRDDLARAFDDWRERLVH